MQNNKANAIDTAVNKLFAASVDEEQWSDSDVRLWNTGVSITFKIPPSDGKLQEKQGSSTLHPVGTWIIRFASPRPSVFANIDICTDGGAAQKACKTSFDDAAKAAEAAIQPADVLEFKLSDNGNDLGTVEAYIKKQEWYTTALKAFSGTPKAPDAALFCRSLKDSVASLDLNSVDQGIIAYAAVAGLSIPDAGYKLLKAEKLCQCSYNSCPALPDTGS